MRLGTVIGRVTLCKAVPALTGARWLIVSPFTREHFQSGSETPPGMSKDPSLVVYDDLGGGVGQTIGFVEGRNNGRKRRKHGGGAHHKADSRLPVNLDDKFSRRIYPAAVHAISIKRHCDVTFSIHRN